MKHQTHRRGINALAVLAGLQSTDVHYGWACWENRPAHTRIPLEELLRYPLVLCDQQAREGHARRAPL
jgi:hypothetical protein